MHCSVCDVDDGDLTHLKLYTIGSEGTVLCRACNIKVCEYIRSLMSVKAYGFASGFKAGRKQRKPSMDGSIDLRVTR